MTEPKPIMEAGGVRVERRDRSDASVSVGKWRVRLPQWMFWVLLVLAVLIPICITIIEVASLKWTGKPVAIRGIVEASRHGSYTNRIGAIEARVSELEGLKK